MAISINSKVKEIVENPQAAAVLDKYIAGMSTAPGTKQAYGMTLKMVCSFPQTPISKEKVAEMAAELEALGI